MAEANDVAGLAAVAAEPAGTFSVTVADPLALSRLSEVSCGVRRGSYWRGSSPWVVVSNGSCRSLFYTAVALLAAGPPPPTPNASADLDWPPGYKLLCCVPK